jgi:hypothetical protein
VPTRYTKRGELQQFQYEIQNEISRDAKPIADGVFGNNARHPDMASVSNAELDALYADAYRRNDRNFLMQEAQRDPQQFLDVTDRIGVPDPPLGMDGKPTGIEPDAFEQALKNPQNAAIAAPPTPTPGAAAVGGAPPIAAVPPPAALPAPAAAPPVQPTLPGM